MDNAEDSDDTAHLSSLITRYYADPASRLSFARDLFNHTALHYDRVNRLFSLGSGSWYRRSCLRRAGLRPGFQVLDIAVGTGLLAREVLAITGEPRAVIGVDVSEAMLSVARNNLDIPLVQGTAEALPFSDEVADFVTMGYAVRHVADLKAAFRECIRVLRPQGTLLLLEISSPRKRLTRIFASMYIGTFVPFFALLATGDLRARALMRHHWETIVSCLPPSVVMRALSDSGFGHLDCRTELDMFHCYIGHKA